MKDIFTLLSAQKRHSLEIFVASLFITVFGVMSALYVMQVLERYIGYGITSTLFTLAVGVILAIGFEFLFRLLRHSVAVKLIKKSPIGQIHSTYNAIVEAPIQALTRINPTVSIDVPAMVQRVRGAFGAHNLATFFDVPFAFIFLIALAVLEGIFAVITLGFMGMVIGLILVIYKINQTPERLALGYLAQGNSCMAAAQNVETVRLFNVQSLLKKRWATTQERGFTAQEETAYLNTLLQSGVRLCQALLMVTIITTAAFLTAQGELTISAMIGANILSVRALQPISRLALLTDQVTKGIHAYQQLVELNKLPREKATGLQPSTLKGHVEFKDMAFAHPNAIAPLFESVSCMIEAGQIVAVTGVNGAGKSTFAHLTAGLLTPARGQILFDGVDVRHYDPRALRRHFFYYPQDPTFFTGSVRDNITSLNPQASEAMIEAAVQAAALQSYLNECPQGLETLLAQNGRHLPLGIRKRLALARAFLSQHSVAFLDEPFEGLDPEGLQAVQGVIRALHQKQATIFVFTHDMSRLKGIDLVINLSAKPKPEIFLTKTPQREGAG